MLASALGQHVLLRRGRRAIRAVVEGDGVTAPVLVNLLYAVEFGDYLHGAGVRVRWIRRRASVMVVGGRSDTPDANI